MSIKKNPYKKTFIIAELGTSHGGSIKKAEKLIDAAIEAGADCIKFQWVYANEILHPNTGFVDLPTGKIRLYDTFKKLEQHPSFYYHLQNYITARGKKFMCSPFGSRSLEELFALKPDYIKIASPELNHIPLLEELVEQELFLKKEDRIPVILSSGVSTLKDIENALHCLKPIMQSDSNAVSLLHCVTSYPAPETDYNLAVIQTLKDTFSIPIGVSDHSLHPTIVPVLSVACGGSIIEKHFTLSRTTDGLDDPVALTPHDFKKMVNAVRKIEKLDFEAMYSECFYEFGEDTVEDIIGDGKKVLAVSEKQNYGKTNRSIHVLHDMKKGAIITKNDIAILRTEKNLTPGLEPIYLKKILGLYLTKDIHAGQGITKDDINF